MGGLNLRLKRGVDLCDSLYRFWEILGVGTATLEANLAQQLARLAHEPLFQVFLDVQRAYGCWTGGGFLEILRGVGLGTNLDRLLRHYWEKQRVVTKAGKFLGRPFGTGWGIM